jgi:hypothetical protein
MTVDLTVVHRLTTPEFLLGVGRWYGWCTCGDEFTGPTAQAVRDAGLPHRLAEISRLRKTPSEVEDKGSDVG